MLLYCLTEDSASQRVFNRKICVALVNFGYTFGTANNQTRINHLRDCQRKVGPLQLGSSPTFVYYDYCLFLLTVNCRLLVFGTEGLMTEFERLVLMRQIFIPRMFRWLALSMTSTQQYFAWSQPCKQATELQWPLLPVPYPAYVYLDYFVYS